jgi:hypothetical protein
MTHLLALRFPIHQKNEKKMKKAIDTKSQPAKVAKSSDRKENEQMATQIKTPVYAEKKLTTVAGQPVKTAPVAVVAGDRPKLKRGGPRLGQAFYEAFIPAYQAATSISDAVLRCTKATGKELTEDKIRQIVSSLRSDHFKVTGKNPDGTDIKVLERPGIKALQTFKLPRKPGGGAKSLDWASIAALAVKK